MRWDDNSRLKGTHGILSASTPTWIDSKSEDIFQRCRSSYSRTVGTLIHELAEDCIKTGNKLYKKDITTVRLRLDLAGIPRSMYDIAFIMPTLTMYVNDAIGYGMRAEEVLAYYGDATNTYDTDAKGTADSIIFDEEKRILRIHDLKTGISKPDERQLISYAALFLLEYGQRLGIKPQDIRYELKFYHSGTIIPVEPTPDIVEHVMREYQDKLLMTQKFKEGAL